MATQQPYMLLHPSANPVSGYNTGRNLNNPHAGFNVAQAVTSITSTASSLAAASSVSGYRYGNAAASGSTPAQTSSFRAPAHKHAHHLHSIPPREKSTRTLIVDHMLWVHGRTRFAQARAELGMTDRTGGPSSSSYSHRTRPENYEEADELGSEGEEPSWLKAREGGPGHPHNDEEDERLGRQDLTLARSLRLRAEGLEKVVSSMLDQPPPILHPLNDNDVFTPPTSPNLNPIKTGKHPHTLPNGVRLRLALGTIINDLFARQAPHPPYRHTHPSTPHVTSPSEQHSPSPLPSHPSDIPEALIPLLSISGAYTPAQPQSSSGHQRSHSQTQSQASPLSSRSSPYLSYTPPSNSPNAFQSFTASPSSNPPSASTLNPARQFQTGPSPFSVSNPQHHTHNHNHNPSPPQPFVIPQKPTEVVLSERSRAFYAAGADPSTANSPPAFRCPRHLHTGCDICVEAKSPPRQSGGSGSGRSGGSMASFGHGTVGVTSPGISNSALNISTNNTWKAMPSGPGPGGGGITGWQDRSGIGSGLLNPGVRGSALRRKVGGLDKMEQEEGTTGAGNTKLSKLIPRFIRLSALVAGELGREARGEEEDFGSGKDQGQASSSEEPATSVGGGVSGSTSWDSSNNSNAETTPAPSMGSPVLGSASPQAARARAHKKMYDYALRPTVEWYLLLAGLLTRAVLEGYLTAGWRGTNAVECLLRVGLGLGAGDLQEDSESEAAEKEADEFAEFNPDELPSLIEAVKVLFPSLRNTGAGGGRKGKGKAEEEYEYEMCERLRRFYDIPSSTPDLSTHMEDLAWQYPAEPVERAAVRFCEAIAKWRGKPELETYKKPQNVVDNDPNSFPGAMTIESLVHSNPTSPTIRNAATGRTRMLKKPSIDVYFAAPVLRDGGLGAGWLRSPGKRSRDSDEGVGGMSKRMHT